jgi:beta-dihydromenaquinone-9 omega-hydroxylase
MALELAARSGAAVGRETRAGAAAVARRLRGDLACGAEPTEIGPLDPDVLADPYPWYRQLHRGGPVHYHPRLDLWLISHYDQVRTAARAHDELSSAHSVARFRARLPMMLTVDRPEHSRLRRIAARDFTREAMERWRPAIEELAREAVGEMLSSHASDGALQLASPLPVAVIARILGVPTADLADFRDWSDRVAEGFGVEPGPGSVRSSARVLGAAVALRGYFAAQFERLRRSPGDDVISRLIASSEAGALSQDELFWFVFMLLIAGNETTTNLLGTMMLAFAEQPDQYAKVREDPGLVPDAVEESLRHVSPIQGLYRSAVSGYRVGSATIPAGGRVLLLFGAANRDPRKYPDPDRFDVERNPSDHVAFGSGIHYCLGAHLARLEAAVVLRELIERVERIELAGEPVWRDNPSLRGLARLPVRLVASRPAPARR